MSDSKPASCIFTKMSITNHPLYISVIVLHLYMHSLAAYQCTEMWVKRKKHTFVLCVNSLILVICEMFSSQIHFYVTHIYVLNNAFGKVVSKSVIFDLHHACLNI